MGDFEDRVGRALGGGAEGAPSAHGLADGARRRLRVRRQRLAIGGAAAAVLAVVLPVAVIGGSGGSSPGRGGEGAPATDGAEAADVRVTCGGDTSWPVSAMADGIPNDVAEEEVRTAFARLEAAAGIDAPRAIQQQGADGASYIVLAVTDDEVTLGVGRWTVDGPDGGQVLTLERSASGLRPAGWGDCRLLEVALPEGRSRVEVTAPRGGVDPSATSLVVVVNELQCASGRDPAPYLGRPLVVEEDDRVLVTMSSEEVVGGADCQGNPHVPVTLDLDEPLGDRQLFDAGTWPPTPIRVAAADEGWQTVAQDDARADLPPDWREVDCDFGGGEQPIHGPTEVDACEFGAYAAFYGSATFDPADLPGVVNRSEDDGEVTWSGYVGAGEWVLSAASHDRDLTRRILASARVAGEPVVVAERWETGGSGGLEWQVPVGWGVDGGSASSYGVEVTLVRSGGEPVLQSLPERLDDAHVRMYGDIGSARITVTAPTRAVAELVLSSVVVATG